MATTEVTETRTVPLSLPKLEREEIAAVAAVLESGHLAQGEVVEAFERAFARYIGCEHAIATSSGTTALHLALLALGIGPGDEVITTPFTFIATVTSILHIGAKPVFADIDPATLNLSPQAVEQAVTTRTRAIMPVHLYGNPCDMPALQHIADQHGLHLIEDACQAHGASVGGRRLGSDGIACFSFYPTKNMTCGEGGMICTSDATHAETARLLRSHGMRRRYWHETLGHNFRMTDIHAAIGLPQLRRLDSLNRARNANAAYYDTHLDSPRRPAVHPGAQPAWHQYTVRVEPDRREAIADYLTRRGIGIGIYYPVPAHRQPVIEQLGITGDFPVSEAAAASVLSIPVHPGLNQEDRAYVALEVNRARLEA